jgi:hypothetical protein
MSFVCLSSPNWSTDAAFPVDLAPALLASAPRIVVAGELGEKRRVWVDARGVDPASLASTLLTVAQQLGLADVRASAAATPIAAEIAVMQAMVPLTIVKPGSDREFIAPFPIAVLVPSGLLSSLLEGIGVENCGALARLDAESVEVRLGAEGVRLWKLARADDPRVLFSAPLRSLPSASLDWVEYALRDPERLLFVINALVGNVCTSLIERGERAQEIVLVFSLANRTQITHPLRSARPTATQKAWMRLIRVALDSIRLPDAVTGVTLRAESVTGNDGAQGDLFDRGFASAPAVESAVAQLVDDQGDVILTPRNSKHPLVDLRTEWVGEEPVRAVMTHSAHTPATHNGGRSGKAGPQLTLQLLSPPRRIVVTTTRRRDHDVPVRYRDGKTWYAVVEAAGPDRVSGGQWDTAYAREYFRCVREDGMLVWLYRGGETEWHLHGWWD